jgi:MoaA/NifB/PqqE/SkfB family radical SAM enzyme
MAESGVCKVDYKTGMVHGPPEIAVIEVTNRCNLNCIMCYRLEYLNETGDMSFELFQQIAQTVKGAKHICCHGGGEPLLHPRILEMIDCAWQICRPQILSITTNGTMLNHKVAEKLCQSKLNRLFVSMDGADKETYENIRGFPFEQIVENVKRFKSISTIPTVIQYTVMRQNLRSLLGLPRLVSQMGADGINVQHLIAWNRGTEKMRIIDLHREFQKISQTVTKEARDYGIECTVNEIPRYPLFLGKCDLPFRQVYFNHRGGIAPCCIAIHLSLEDDFTQRNGRNIRDWRRRVIRGDFPQECKTFCYFRGSRLRDLLHRITARDPES